MTTLSSKTREAGSWQNVCKFIFGSVLERKLAFFCREVVNKRALPDIGT